MTEHKRKTTHNDVKVEAMKTTAISETNTSSAANRGAARWEPRTWRRAVDSLRA